MLNPWTIRMANQKKKEKQKHFFVCAKDRHAQSERKHLT